MSETPVTVPFVSFRPMERELDADLRGAFARVLDNSWYIGGREDAAFEKAFADYCGVRHCVGCGNGLDAMVLILKAMGIGPGDEVIAPSNTFIATVLAISYAGAAPVLVEPTLESYNIDPARIEAMFLATSIKWSYLSSTIVKEAARYGSSISKFVTPNVEAAVEQKMAELHSRGENV